MLWCIAVFFGALFKFILFFKAMHCTQTDCNNIMCDIHRNHHCHRLCYKICTVKYHFSFFLSSKLNNSMEKQADDSWSWDFPDSGYIIPIPMDTGLNRMDTGFGYWLESSLGYWLEFQMNIVMNAKLSNVNPFCLSGKNCSKRAQNSQWTVQTLLNNGL